MKLSVLFVCLLSAVAAFAQGGAVTAVPTITNTRGEPVPYAQVAVCSSNPGSLPLTVCNGNFATIYTDVTIATPCQNNVTPIKSISGAGCTNPGKSDGLGNVIAYAAAGQYWCEYSGGSITRPIVVPCFFANGGGSANLNCPAALNGSIGAFTAPTAFSCDQNFFTDFQGNWTSQSGRTIGPVNGYLGVIGGGLSPGSAVKYKLGANEFRWLGTTQVTPWYYSPPTTNGVPAQCWNLASQSTDGNGDMVNVAQWFDCASKQGVQQEAYTYAADTGAANAYAVTLSPATSIVAGSIVQFKAAHSNTTTSTLNVNGGGATTIKKWSGGSLVALTSGDITAGQIINVQYDGTQWQVVSGGGGGGTTTITTYLPMDQCTAAQSANQGNSFWSVVALTNWDYGHWEFVLNTQADIYCSVRVPHAVAGTPNAAWIIDPASSDTTASHTVAFQTSDAITASLNPQVTLSTASASQNYTSTTTAYATTELAFTVQATVAADQILVVKIHQVQSSSVTANIVMPPPKLRIDQTL